MVSERQVGPTTQSSRRASWRWLLAVGLVASPLVLFFLARGSLSIANAWLERRYPPPGEMIAVGGHRLHLYCQGAGTATVVIEPGLGVDWVAWLPVVADLARTANVCVYDRAGYGWSEAGPLPRTAERSAIELHELLSRSKQPGPYVLVAHSFGGHIARVYAGRFADSVGGIVLVDPSEARQSDAPAAAAPDPPPNRPWSVSGLIDLLPPLGWERVKRLYQGDSAFPADLQKLPAGFRHRIVIASSLDQLVAEQSELDSMRASQEQAWAAAAPPSLPVVVITPVHPADSAEAAAAAERRELHRQLAATFASGTQVFAERSGHMVHEDQPALVTAVIRDVLAKVPGAVK